MSNAKNMSKLFTSLPPATSENSNLIDDSDQKFCTVVFCTKPVEKDGLCERHFGDAEKRKSLLHYSRTGSLETTSNIYPSSQYSGFLIDTPISFAEQPNSCDPVDCSLIEQTDDAISFQDDNTSNNRCKYRASAIHDDQCKNSITSQCSHCSSTFCMEHKLRHQQDVEEEVSCLLGEAQDLIAQIPSLTIETGKKDCIEQYKQWMEIIMNEIKERFKNFQEQLNYLHNYIEKNRDTWKKSLITQIETNIISLLMKQSNTDAINGSEVNYAKNELLRLQNFHDLFDGKALINVSSFDDNINKINTPRLCFSNEILSELNGIDESLSDNNSEIKEYLKQHNIDTDNRTTDSNIFNTSTSDKTKYESDEYLNTIADPNPNDHLDLTSNTVNHPTDNTSNQITTLSSPSLSFNDSRLSPSNGFVHSNSTDSVIDLTNDMESDSNSVCSIKSELKPATITRTSNENPTNLKSENDSSNVLTSNNVTVSKRLSCYGNSMLVVNGFSYVSVHTTLNDEFIRFSPAHGKHFHLPDSGTKTVKQEKAAKRRYEKSSTTKKNSTPAVPRDFSKYYKSTKNLTPPQSVNFTIPTMYVKESRTRYRILLHDSSAADLPLTERLTHVRSIGRVLIWASHFGSKLLFDSERLYMADSHHVVPSLFVQLFVILTFYKGMWIPVLHALLPDRSAITYSYLFDVLCEEATKKNKNFNPLLIMTEYEPGILEAISSKFTEQTVHKGCLYHFIDLMFKQVEEYDLLTGYLDNQGIQNVIRHLIALALVPSQFVSTLFDKLEKDIKKPSNHRLKAFFSYFRTNWMPNLSVWNVFDIPEGVYNFKEEYFERFKRQANTVSINVWSSMNLIRSEMKKVDKMIKESKEGKPFDIGKHRTKAIEDMKKLYELFIANEITPDELLDELSHFVDDFREKQ